MCFPFKILFQGYYRCANPKYPPFCPLDNASFQWEKIDNKDELR